MRRFAVLLAIVFNILPGVGIAVGAQTTAPLTLSGSMCLERSLDNMHCATLPSESMRRACTSKDATVQLDASVSGRADAFNPVELLLAALSACMIKGLARVAPMLDFDYRSVSVKLRASRQNVPPRIARIEYEILVETEETDHRLNLLHENIRKFGTVSNTVAAGTSLTGTICRTARR